MSVSNDWVTPLQRSYQQIKDKLIESLKLKIPEITDYSEGNIFIILISIFAAIAEVLHYYIDNTARETFFITARKYSSVLKHAKMVDYHVRAANPSMVDVTISKSDNKPISSDLSIPINTEFTANDGTKFLSTKTVTWEKDTFGVIIPLSQKELKSNITFGTLTSENVIITLGDMDSGYYYMEGSMVMYMMIGSTREDWELVDTLAYSGPRDKHYMVEMDITMNPYIRFGDGVNGKKPTVGSVVKGSYYQTKGYSGNIGENNITTVPPVISPAGSVTVTNVYPAVAGTNYESFEMIKEHVPMSIKTLGVAITKEDYEDVTRLTPGVDKAYVNYICGKMVDIYITPDGGGIAPKGLIDLAYQVVLKKKVITTNINVLSTGVSELYLDLEVTGKKSFRSQDISNQIVDTLLNSFNYSNSDIGKPIRISDLYALVDNLSTVDYLTIKNIFLKPWAQRVGNTIPYLNISYFQVTKVIREINILVTYIKGGNQFFINDQDKGVKIVELKLGELTPINYDGNIITMKIDNPSTGLYIDGDKWSFRIIPNNQDQELKDFTIPVITSKSSITLNIFETV